MTVGFDASSELQTALREDMFPEATRLPSAVPVQETIDLAGTDLENMLADDHDLEVELQDQLHSSSAPAKRKAVDLSDIVVLTDNREPCKHTCKDKIKCSHECCKTGVLKSRKRLKNVANPPSPEHATQPERVDIEILSDPGSGGARHSKKSAPKTTKSRIQTTLDQFHLSAGLRTEGRVQIATRPRVAGENREPSAAASQAATTSSATVRREDPQTPGRALSVPSIDDGLSSDALQLAQPIQQIDAQRQVSDERTRSLQSVENPARNASASDLVAHPNHDRESPPSWTPRMRREPILPQQRATNSPAEQQTAERQRSLSDSARSALVTSLAWLGDCFELK